MDEGPELSPEIEELIRSSDRPRPVQDAMRDLLLALRAADPEVVVSPGYAGWRAIEVSKRGRRVMRLLTKRALVQVESFVPGSRTGDYGDNMVLGQKGEWTSSLAAGEVPDELLRCVSDALVQVEGRPVRVRPPGSASPARVADQARASRRSPLPASIRFAVLVRDNYTCQYCGRSAPEGVVLHVDHRLPVSRGGSDNLDNLVTACAECNLGKGARHIT